MKTQNQFLSISPGLFAAFLLAWFSQPLLAESKLSTEFGDYKVLHSVFNSSFIKPDVASAYNLTRGKDRALVNVALIKNGDSNNGYGLPAEVTGSVANLMQQKRELVFVEIRERDAVYYLADLRFDHEEVLHFSINVKGQGDNFAVKFSKKLYQD